MGGIVDSIFGGGPEPVQGSDPFAQVQAQIVNQYTPQGNFIGGFVGEDGEFVPRTGGRQSAVRVEETPFQELFRGGREDLSLALLGELTGDIQPSRTVRMRGEVPETLNEFRQESRIDPRTGLPTAPSIDDVGVNLTPLGTDFAGRANELADATFEAIRRRLDPRFMEEEERLKQDLANQGITIGSEAFDTELDRFAERRGDTLTQAALQAEQVGSAEQERLARLAMAQRGQEFGEQATTFDLSRALRDQLFNENFNTRSQAFNEAIAEKDSSLRKRLGIAGLDNQVRAQQFSELGALLGFAPQYQPVFQASGISPVQQQQSTGAAGALGQVASAALPLIF